MRIISCLLLLFGLSSGANAHKLAPSLLELRQLPSGIISVWWKTPVLAVASPSVVLPSSCQRIGGIKQEVVDNAIERRYSISCSGESSLVFSINGLAASRSAALLRWYGDGGQQQKLLRSDEDSFSPEDSADHGSTVVQFTALGVEHILIGIDHLLFVLGLLLVAQRRKRLFVWVSAFTVGHSITLFMVSLGYIPHWPNVAEWLIAASVFAMALYAEVDRAGRQYGKVFVMVVGAFGLLHGLGFASVLAELAVPSGKMLPALLGFNIGIELGQLLFLAGVSLILLFWQRLLFISPNVLQRSSSVARGTTVYVMGSVASYWMIDRGLSVFEAAVMGAY
ncbi:Uncharacterised protein [Zhongshania aliphaticivorans]|uniref:HupE / UreJ protein n=1 Tax=Zhongshania aliphaticivorans TaxID=1470434 RepID=A0A5S9QQ12_9GAMM|nr:HupE/UreJ family protein [Zhongshania aliphaticivorans]CAA0087630.1 Uncharacterised protein [Zhongshania aliphaticivorans]CAA0115241.1 Uncharacterised protein [Zhongshania aliphaticivorans]CAA0120082.1 Uncharacterised protein [Zhongshania aliphaticivorans]